MDSIRKKNIERIAERLGSKKAAAEALSGEHGYIAPSIISNIISGRRGLGERMARKMEKNMGLPAGSLDQEEFAANIPEMKKTDPKRQALHGIIDILPESAIEWVTFQAKIALTSPAFKASGRSKKQF